MLSASVPANRPPAAVVAAVILAGGPGRRMGGRDKPMVPVDGVPMLRRVLAAAATVASEIVVVGPDRGDLAPPGAEVSAAGGGAFAAGGGAFAAGGGAFAASGGAVPVVGGEVLAAGGGLPAAGGGLGVAGSAGGEALAVGGGGEVFAAGDGGAGGGLAVAGGETNVADGGEVLPSSGGEVLPAGGGGEVFAAGDGVARGGLAVAGGETGVAGGGAEGEAGARGEVALVGGVGRWDGRVRPGAHVRVRTVQEEPAGGGPVAGLGAGLAALVEPVDVVLVLAADLPRLDGVAVQRLVGAVGGYDGALFVDQDGRRQLLCGAWRIGVLQQALQRIGSLDGVAMRRLVDGLAINDVRWDESGIPPYFDCDTDEDLRRVHE